MESDSARAQILSTHPDLELQELHVVDCLLKHGADVHLGPVGHQVLQDLQPLIDPLPPLLQSQRNTAATVHTCQVQLQRGVIDASSSFHF